MDWVKEFTLDTDLGLTKNAVKTNKTWTWLRLTKKLVKTYRTGMVCRVTLNERVETYPGCGLILTLDGVETDPGCA